MSPNLLLFHQSGIMIKLAVACGLFYKPGTSSNFAIMHLPRKLVPFLPSENQFCLIPDPSMSVPLE